MAKIRTGSLVSDVRGSQGGTVFSRNKGGAYTRDRVAPTNVSSDARTRQRNIFSANSKAWGGTLTEDERGAWTVFALANPVTDVFGASILLSGIAMYQRLNSILQTIEEDTIDLPPTDLTVTPNALALGLTVSTTGPVMTVETVTQVLNADTVYYVWVTAPMSPGRTPQNSQFRYLGAYESTATEEALNIAGLFIPKFGTPVAGLKYAVLVAQASVTKGAVLAGQVFTTIAT